MSCKQKQQSEPYMLDLRTKVAELLPNPATHFSFPCSPSESPLRGFISLPKAPLLVLGPRRGKPVFLNGPNSYTSLNISTPVGHRNLEITAYLQAIASSRPDVIIAPVDIEFDRPVVGSKRREKIVERSTAWVRSFETVLNQSKSKGGSAPAAWIPILPLELEVQSTYLQHLEEADSSFVDGILVYDAASTICVPQRFRDLPLISLTNPQTPHDILKLVALGVDLIAAPFVTNASEAGIALDFEFSPKQNRGNKALGVDLWSESYAVDLGPLSADCSCYTCKHHHKAYIRHLLSVKEMLAWVLLQIHNYHIMENFFRDIRSSIKDGSFEKDGKEFNISFESEFPRFQGQGPRIRGYQTSLGANSKKLNQAPFKRMGQDQPSLNNGVEKTLDNGMEKALESHEAGVLSPGIEAAVLEDLGFAVLYNGDVKQDVDYGNDVEGK